MQKIKNARKPRVLPKLDFSRMKPYPLQQEIMDHPARFKIVAFGRQSGKSWLARRILLEQAANFRRRCWWVAPSIPTATDHWSELVRLIENSNIPVRSINKSTKMIEFIGGGSIRIRSAEIPDHLRGGTLDFLVLDEAAFMHENVWFKVLQPTITASGGRVLFLSTPNGKNWYYRLFLLGQDEKYPDFASWSMPSTESPYQDKQLLEIIRQTVPNLVWREEYLAEFISDSGGVFTGLDDVPYYPPLREPEPGHVYVAGIDWGLEKDYTVITFGDRHENRQVYGERFNANSSSDQIEKIADLLMLWRPETVCIEINGMGQPLFDILKKTLKKRNIEAGFNIRLKPIHVTNQLKRKIIEDLSAAIEFGRFTPLTRRSETDYSSFGAIQYNELSLFQRKRTLTGLDVAYMAPDGSNDDTVMALAYMYHALVSGTTQTNEKLPPIRKIPRTGRRSPFQTNYRFPIPLEDYPTRRYRNKDKR